jgi:integrase
MRIGETSKLLWTDIDYERRSIRVTPEKGSNPRILPMSTKLEAMLKTLQSTATSDHVFPRSVRNQRRVFTRQRKRIAWKLHNPRIKKITFHTFRHFKATMEYQKTKDILHVMRLLGHRSIQNTLIYTHLIDFKDDEYVSKVATSPDEACQLIDAGFSYVCQIDDAYIFRKRK